MEYGVSSRDNLYCTATLPSFPDVDTVYTFHQLRANSFRN